MSDLFTSPSTSPLVIGMLHVPALPGSPTHSLSLAAIKERVLNDAAKLTGASTVVLGSKHSGVDALMIENFGDLPFYPGRVPHEVVAYLTMLAAAIKQTHPNVPLGINVLRNDGLSALAVAHAANADFIRVNILNGARVTDQGILQGIAHDLLRLRKILNAEHIKILADVDVKHSSPLGSGRPIEVEVDDLVYRGFADALIVSGAGTGKATDLSKLATVKSAAGTCPVLVGSGATEASLPDLAQYADGFIVGTSLKENGIPAAPVDQARTQKFLQTARSLKRPQPQIK